MKTPKELIEEIERRKRENPRNTRTFYIYDKVYYDLCEIAEQDNYKSVSELVNAILAIAVLKSKGLIHE